MMNHGKETKKGFVQFQELEIRERTQHSNIPYTSLECQG